MKKKEMDAMESQLRDKLMKERWQKTAEQEKQMKYAIKIPLEDGGWLYVTETKEDGSRDIKTYNTYAEAQRDNTLVWSNKGEVVECHKDPFGNPMDKLTEKEIEELRAKKQAIKEALYDAVKMEMFKANSKLEGIDYEDKEVSCKTHPDAPHGFDRNASLSLNRYVCECEHWFPDWEPENPVKEIHDWSELKIESEKVLVEGYDIQNRKELKQLLESMIDRMDRIEYGYDDE